MQRMVSECVDAGLEPPRFTETSSMFRIEFMRPVYENSSSDAKSRLESRPESELAARVIIALKDAEMSSRELSLCDIDMPPMLK